MPTLIGTQSSRLSRMMERVGSAENLSLEHLEPRQLFSADSSWITVSPDVSGGFDVLKFGAGSPAQYESSVAGAWKSNLVLPFASTASATGRPAQWLDAGEGRTYSAVPTNEGLHLYSEQTPGVWSDRNLTRELLGSNGVLTRATSFVTGDGITHVVALDASGGIWDYQRTPSNAGVGSGIWSVRDVRAALLGVGQSAPLFVGDVTGFGSPTKRFNLVGLDQVGTIRTVEAADAVSGSYVVRTIPLAGIAPALTGRVRVAHSGAGTHLLATSTTGDLVLFTRAERAGARWVRQNISALTAGLKLSEESVTASSNGLGLLIIAGIDALGNVRTITQAPGVGSGWRSSNVNRLASALPKLTGQLSISGGTGASLSIIGCGVDGLLRRFKKGDTGNWKGESIEALATARQLNTVIRESASVANTVAIPVDLGAISAGVTSVAFTLKTKVDRTGPQSIIQDAFNVYVVSSADRSVTLLDHGRQGTPVLSVRGGVREFVPGVVQFDGDRVTIDLSSIQPATGQSRAVILLQTLNSDIDAGSSATFTNITRSTSTDSTGTSPVLMPDDVQAAGPKRAIAALPVAPGMTVEASNVRFDFETRRYSADIRVRNSSGVGGTSLRSAFVTFSNLPAGVRLRNASGRSADGRSYVNFTTLLGTDGLQPGTTTPWVSITFDNPQLARFALTPAVVGAINHAPVALRVTRKDIHPGGYLEVPLLATDADGDRVRFTIRSVRGVNGAALPTSELSDDNVLILRPTPAQIGRYVFDVIASDGIAESSKRVIVDVTPDAITTTRISGRVLGTNGQALVGVPVTIGTVGGITDASGRFLLEVPSSTGPTAALEIKGSALAGAIRYPFVAEKLELLLDRTEVFAGNNNVVGRPIYLPALDTANATQVDPTVTTVVRTAAIPQASVTIAAGTLRDMADPTQPFTGMVSITQVPRLLTPAALPPGQNPDLVVTIQPGDMTFSTPAPLSLPNTGGYAPGRVMDLWSINPNTGLFDNVGRGRVSSDGTRIDTISGGIRNSSWHFFSPPPDQATNPDDNPQNEDQGCPSCGASASGSSEVDLHSGELVEMHSLVSYQSQGIERGLTLRYGSLRADPRPILHLGFTSVRAGSNRIIAANVVVERGTFRYEIPGQDATQFGISQSLNFWKSPASGGTVRIALQADLHNQETGRYKYRILQGVLDQSINASQTRLNGSMATTTAELVIVNERLSAFGAGWSLGGVQRIVENPGTGVTGDPDRYGSALLVDGDGTQLVFLATSTPGTYTSPSGDFTTLRKLTDGTWTRRFTDGTISAFDILDRLISQTDRNGNVTRHAYDAAGRLISITDPVGLVTRLAYNAQGKVLSITDPAGRATRMAYDAAGNLVQITDPDGSARSFTYDACGRMTGETDKRGFSEIEEYDSFGRIRRMTRADGTILNVMPVQVEGLFDALLTTNLSTAPTALTGASRVEARVVDSNGQVMTDALDRRGQVVSSRDNVGTLSSYVRNASNLPTRMTDARGFVTNMTYDSRGNMLTSTDPIGSQTYQYDATFSRVTRFTDGLNHSTNYDIDPANGNVRSVTAADGAITTYTYNAAGQPLTMTDARGFITEYAYNAAGRLVRLTSAKGTPSEGVRRYEYDAAGNVIASIDENNNRSTYAYDSMGRMLTSEDALGNTTQYLYDADGNLTRTIDARGNASQNRYDARDRIVRSIAPDGSATVYAYDTVGNLTSMTDAIGQITRYEYDARNRLLRTIDPRGGAVSYAYDASDNLVRVTDALGNITRYSFDSRDRLTTEVQVITGSDSGIDFNYRNWRRLSHRGSSATGWTVGDVDGTPTFTTDDNLSSASFVTSGMLLQDSEVTTRVNVSTRDSDDDFIGIVFAMSTAPNSTAAGSALSPDNYYVLTWKRADQGNLFTGGPAEQGVKLLKVTGAALASDDSISGQIWDGEDTANVDVLFRNVGPGKGWQHGITYAISLNYAASGAYSIVITNDDTGVVIQTINVTDPTPLARGQYGYLSQSQSDIIYSPTVSTRRYEYDRADNLTAMVDRNRRRTTYTYDVRNRLLSETWVSGGYSAAYTYDAVGNRLTAVDPYSSLAMTYDPRNRIATVSNAGTPGVTPVVLTYQYDAVGNVIAVTDDISGSGGGDTRYTYDRDNRVTRITQGQTGAPANPVSNKRVDFAYNQLGQYTGVSHFGGAAGATRVAGTTYAYDNRNRVTAITHTRQNGQSIAFFNYAYDAASRITLLADADGATMYAYDATDQLTGADYSTGAGGLARSDEQFSYDLNGNRITSARSAAHVTGPHNRLLEDATYTYEYDKEGNLTKRTEKSSGNTRAFSWDFRNRLVRIVDAAGVTQQTVDFTYDSTGRRLTKTQTAFAAGVAGTPVTTSFVYDREDIIIRFRDADGSAGPAAPALEQRILHGPGIDEPLMIQTYGAGGATQTVSLFADHLGTIRAELTHGAAGAGAIARRTYDAYGNVVATRGTPVSDYGFTGRELDGETGLMYYRARFYDGGTGRFVSEDPARIGEGAVSLFGYVQNQPALNTDSYGLAPSAPPTNADGSDASPPVPLEPGKNGQPNRWVPANPSQGGSRGAKWKPEHPVNSPGGGQPGASWDPDGHWDVDDGKGGRRRYAPDGTEVDHDNNPVSNPRNQSCQLSDDPNSYGRSFLVGAGLAGTGYLIYRGIRFLPSLFPPLWPTIPFNAVAP